MTPAICGVFGLGMTVNYQNELACIHTNVSIIIYKVVPGPGGVVRGGFKGEL